MHILSKKHPGYVSPFIRVIIMLCFVGTIFIIAKLLTGSWFPDKAKDALIFQNALLLVILGSSVIEYQFTKPADSVINSLTGMITLIAVYPIVESSAWWGIFLYCLIVFIVSTICVIVSTGKETSGWKRKIADFTYPPAVFFGSSRLLFSIIFLYGLFVFYGIQSAQTITLIIFWGFFIVIWPLGLPELLSSIRIKSEGLDPIGKVIQSESPNIVRISQIAETKWDHAHPKIIESIDDQQKIIVPLYSQVLDDQIVSTGLSINSEIESIEKLEGGYVYDPPPENEVYDLNINELLGGEDTSKLIGFVIEGSKIGEILFEIWDINTCHEGKLVWCKVGEKKIFYQITQGRTKEETLESNKRGFQVVTASQLGIIDESEGFIKYPWLPSMNTPIFGEPENFGEDIKIIQDDDFVFGNIPGSKIEVGGPFTKTIPYHTAILGITGSGKTELAFDLIRDADRNGVKTICIDLTAKYSNRLSDLEPINLSLSEEQTDELDQLIFHVETGEYGAGQEKRALKEFVDGQRESITRRVREFLTSEQIEQNVGVIVLQEISNTKATLYLTELFLTCILNFAKGHQDNCPPVLIVVEEAHTVMPEPSTVGLGDYDSRGLVSKIAQIALQGRKYGVGLLVIAQRTATVSKTVLTQCNSIISFTCIDKTSLDFLKNFYGETHVELIPNLPPLHAVIFGNGIRSQRPLVIEIPFDPEKAEFSS